LVVISLGQPRSSSRFLAQPSLVTIHPLIPNAPCAQRGEFAAKAKYPKIVQKMKSELLYQILERE